MILQRMIKVGIVGSRRRNHMSDRIKTSSKFFEIKGDKEVTIVSGGCPKGADKFAEIIAKEYNIPITIHYPDWLRHNNRAGLVRNTKIVEDSDILIACVAPDRTGGTEDTIRKFIKLKGDKNLHIV